MNLNSIVAPLAAVVNPRETVTVLRSVGYATSADGMKTPSYAAGITVVAQIQPMPSNDLSHTGGMSITGDRCTIYLPGQWRGLNRPDQLGGDIIVRADGSRWLLNVVDEQWGGADGWTACTCTRQVIS